MPNAYWPVYKNVLAYLKIVLEDSYGYISDASGKNWKRKCELDALIVLPSLCMEGYSFV